MRRTDFLPVGGEAEDEVLERGYDSLSDDDDDEDGGGCGLEEACEGNVFNIESTPFEETSGGADFC